jgi:integrase
MTWSKTDKRWHKGYRGRRYAVSPKQLDSPASKDASRQAANEWWEAKQKEIDEALGKAKQHPAHIVKRYDLAIRNHRVFAWWHRREGNLEEAAKSEQAIEWLQEVLRSDAPPMIDEWIYCPWGESPDVIVGGITIDQFQSNLQWRERIDEWERQTRAETAKPKEDTIRCHIDDYLATRKAQAEATGKLGTHDTIRHRLNIFRRWLDPLARIETLNEVLWERFCLHLAKQVKDGKLSPSTIQGVQIVARGFIRDRFEKGFIERPPRNLNRRNLSAEVEAQEVEVFTIPEVQQLMDKASERERLYLLLMLNTGMYPVDVANLKPSEVDWEAGRIVRKRSKTKRQSDNVPKVDYPLWRETIRLLRQFGHADGECVLLNANGKPLWREVERDGKFCRISNVKCAFFRLARRAGITKSLKGLRKTSASMLETHAEFGRYAQYFLGHAPRSIADRHYVKPSREQFDRAVWWLAEQFDSMALWVGKQPARSRGRP